jgi:hypothetical protein
LNFDGAPIASKSHTHPANSQTSRLLTWSLSLGVPVLHTTQCIFLNTILLLTVKHEFLFLNTILLLTVKHEFFY